MLLTIAIGVVIAIAIAIRRLRAAGGVVTGAVVVALIIAPVRM